MLDHMVNRPVESEWGLKWNYEMGSYLHGVDVTCNFTDKARRIQVFSESTAWDSNHTSHYGPQWSDAYSKTHGIIP